jgi:2-polyprenyl-3-methyl-5-hydroxy-6-metoxy-1,4-benzoquinol methylase
MSDLKTYIKTKDFLVSNEEFELLSDDRVDLLLTSPTPENLAPYYESTKYISYQDSASTLIDKVYQIVKAYTLKQKVRLINDFSENGQNLLDIGTGTGGFLYTAAKANWKTYGVEPNANAREIAISKNLDIFDTLDNLPSKKFDTITLWHVLEHIPDLEKQLSKIKQLLTDSGTLIVAVPNFRSHDAKYYGRYWAAYDTPRHLWHFSQHSISRLFKNHGLEVIHTKPMLFDSYYVSLLSEKYKTGKSNIFKAIYQGWLSNWKAKGTGEYSSLIYILQRA